MTNAYCASRGGDWLDGILGPSADSRHPFSFAYAGKPSDSLLSGWTATKTTDHGKSTTTWTDPDTGLKVTWECIRYSDFPAAEWILHFENTGTKDTSIIENIQAMDVTITTPISPESPYLLHKTKGAPSDATDFEPSVVTIDAKHSEYMCGDIGRSSNTDFPFFKIETGQGSVIVAVGWSGLWQSRLECADDRTLHVTAGLKKTHLLLHPGERVRSPRILVLDWKGDALEANAQFRQLIYKHYAAKRDGKTPVPTVFCNTCFTRGGGWLNETTADNQISLIKAYAPLGLEALITDAGWMEGGWFEGTGTWKPRKDNYPQGMKPVAAAAKENGMVYGLWFEVESVIHGTWLHKNHSEWLIDIGYKSVGNKPACLLNLGLPAVQDYLFKTVKGFMDLPGFRVYRQDYGLINPEPFWQAMDKPNRVGIAEMKYVEGLYAYWDRIAAAYPDSLREECAAGGRRIDLETIMRMHIHQKSDYWFHYDDDQAAIWGLSQYLPNNCFVAHLENPDEYGFRSTMASSLCLGWVADSPAFDSKTGKKLIDRYKQVRHLLTGAWYPLLPYTRDPGKWMASQYHRPDLGEGMVLVFRHKDSPYEAVDLALHGLDPKTTYEVSFDSTGAKTRASGAELMKRLEVTIPEKRGSDLIVYRKVKG